MPYAERTYFLLGTGIALIGAGWFFLAYVPRERAPLPPAEALQLPAQTQDTATPEASPAVGEPAAEAAASSPAPEATSSAPAVTVAEGESALAPAAPAPDVTPPPAAEPVLPAPLTEPVPPPAPAPPAVEPPAPVSPNGSTEQAFPLPESTATNPAGGRDAPIQMVPARSAPQAPDGTGDGASQE